MMFLSKDFKRLLSNKHIVLIGDFNMRNIYLDLILFLQADNKISAEILTSNCSSSYFEDVLLFRNESDTATAGHHDEDREYHSHDGFHLVQYYHVPKCYGSRIKKVFSKILEEVPNIILMNSCFLDITRNCDGDYAKYSKNLDSLFDHVRSNVPFRTSFIWLTAPPVGSAIEPAFLSGDLKFMESGLPACVLQANYLSSMKAGEHGLDVLDLHYYLSSMQNHRSSDGYSWDEYAHRLVSNLICMFLYDAWGVDLPSHVLNEMERVYEKEPNLSKNPAFPPGMPEYSSDRMRRFLALF